MTDLLDYRSQFDSLQNCHHLISNSLGAMPNRAREMAAAYTDMWATRGVRAWEEDWWMLTLEVGNKIGSLLNAHPNTVSMHANVTSAEAVVLSCFDFKAPRNKIVMVDMEFPSIQYLYHEWIRDRGEIEMVACPDNLTVPTEQVLEAIDDRTLLVPISHVLFRSSYIVDAAAIIEKAHSVGAMVVLDVFQSLGSVPVDVESLNVDFAVGGCLKWMCGGPGACFLYVRPDLIDELTPRFTGWLAHQRPFDFERRPIQHTTGAYKFLNGTPVVPALFTCRPGIDIVTEIGVERIRRRSMEMTALLLEQADLRGWDTMTPRDPDERAGTVALHLPDAREVTGELLKRDFLVDFRPGAGIRVSPHFYNTDRELLDLFDAIEDIRSRGTHRDGES